MGGELEEGAPSLGSSGGTVFQVLVPAAPESLKQERAQPEAAWVTDRWEWLRGRGQGQRDW